MNQIKILRAVFHKFHFIHRWILGLNFSILISSKNYMKCATNTLKIKKLHQMGQSIQEWIKWNLWKTAFKKFHLVHSWILIPKSKHVSPKGIEYRIFLGPQPLPWVDLLCCWTIMHTNYSKQACLKNAWARPLPNEPTRTGNSYVPNH